MEINELGLQFPCYLGDSVYVGFDGFHIRLVTWNGYPDDPRNKIALEPLVYEALLRWREDLKIKLEEKNHADTESA